MRPFCIIHVVHGSVVVSTDALQLHDTKSLGFDFMEFPHNCGSLLLSFKDIAAHMFGCNESVVSRVNPTCKPSPVEPLDVVLGDMKEILLFFSKNH